MINGIIIKGTYIGTTDDTQFQDFLYRNIYDCELYKDLKPDNNQPARLYETAKTYKQENFEDITIKNLKS